MPLPFSSLQLTLEEKGPMWIQILASKTELFQPEALNAEILAETESSTSAQLLETEASKTDCKECSRLLDFQQGACASPQHSGRSRTDGISVSVIGEKGKTRGTEPRTRLNHTLGVILNRCSINCRLIINSLPRVRAKA